MTKFFSSLINGNVEPNEALADAYTIYGDGVARMDPKKLKQRKRFQENLQAIDDLDVRLSRAKNTKG